MQEKYKILFYFKFSVILLVGRVNQATFVKKVNLDLR